MLQYNQITQLISELLYKHDCVIVPNLGGFVAQNYSAQFTKGSSLLMPPTKQILFNKNLKHNDGLLISSYVEKFNCTFNIASTIIEDYKDYVVSILSAKKRFEINNLGLLYIDSDNEIRFEPKIDVNFLINSFGFEPVIANEIEQVLESRVLKPVFEDRKIKVENKPTKKYSVKQMALLAVGLPVTMLLLFLAANSKPMQPVMQSSLNPFYSAPKNYSPIANKKHLSFYLDKLEKPNLIIDDNGNAIFKLAENGTTLVATINDLERLGKESSTKEKYNSIHLDANYQVVLGCFGLKQNAIKLMKELKLKQINSVISGVNAKGLFVVSCGGFNDKIQATALMNKLKNDFPKAWIMTK